MTTDPDRAGLKPDRAGGPPRSSAQIDRTPGPRVDVCVVGAGPAGGLLAHRLAERGHDVTVLDAGPRFDMGERARLDRMERTLRPGHADPEVWEMGGARDAYSTGRRSYPLNHTRVKGIGGSTLHWQGVVMRLHESDFERGSRGEGDVDWPIDYADLRPYYAAAERELGVAGGSDNPFAPPREEPFPLPAFPPSYSDALFAPACEELGITMHSVPGARNTEPYDGRPVCDGYGTRRPAGPAGGQYSGDVHVRKAEAAGARVVDRTPVQRLTVDRSGERATAAVYATPDGREHRQEARQFVLAAGGVETPRLLLLSTSPEHPDGLANSSGLVGRHFMDHCFAGVGGRLDERTRQHHLGFNTRESHQFYETDDPDMSAIKLEFLNYAGPSPLDRALSDSRWGDDLLDALRESYGSHVGVGALIEQPPRAGNRVRLDPSKTDDHGNPVPRIEWSLGDRTRRTIERANEIQRTILDELGATITWTVGPDSTGPAAHHMGTTRMGDDPATSVVDARLRAHDLANLWVASSSVFPTGGAMNPTLTIAALALMAAENVDEAL
jgi:choline dehydrogenase-like flavoprotein